MVATATTPDAASQNAATEDRVLKGAHPRVVDARKKP
jgi:hypothetical protein